MAISNPAPLGLESALYYNTGTSGSPVWVVVPIVRDVTILYERTEADVSIRGDSGFAATRGALTKLGFDTEIVWYPSATAFAALLSAFNSRTQTEFLVLDNPIANSGAQGPRFIGEVTKFARKEPLDGVDAADLVVKRTLNLTYTTAWYVAS